MPTTNVPRLCGGTFFLQILRMKKPSTRTKKDGLKGEKDQVNNQRVLEALIQFFSPKFQVYADSTFKGDTSDYRACKEATGDNLPFDESRTDFSTFDSLIKNNYDKVLPLMQSFVKRFIRTDEPDRVKKVVRSLLQLIDEDETILQSDLFYMGEMGQPISKTELKKQGCIILEPFLLGIWHFILLNRQNNSIGRDTFLSWNKAPEGKGQQWKYISTIGETYPTDISVRCISDTSFTTDNCSTEYSALFEEELEDDQESYASVENTDPAFLEYKALFVQQTIINPVVNNWYNAPGGIQIGHIDKLELKL